MKLSELEKLAQWHQAMAKEPKRNQAKRDKHFQTAAGITEVCATFREMLEAMKYVQKDLDIRAHLMPDFDESDPCVYIGDGAWKGLCASIKKAEEML